jgi:Tat protein secretion system quality control protein TatD with DNase activity
MRLIDSHAHLDDARFSKNRERIIEALPYQGVRYVINPGKYCMKEKNFLPQSKNPVSGAFRNLFSSVFT